MIDVADILHAAETGAGVGGDGVGNAVTGKLCAAVSILIQAVNTVMLHVSVHPTHSRNWITLIY